MLPKLLNATTSPLGRATTVTEASWITSLVTVGALIGPFLFGYVAKKIGKKWALIIIALPYLISFIIMAFATVIELFYIGRFVNGLAVGGSATTGSNYIIELSNKNNRGLIGASSGITTAFGMLFSYSLGPYLTVMAYNLVFAATAIIFMTGFFLIATECPVYYLNRGDEKTAMAVIEMKQGKQSFFNYVSVFVRDWERERAKEKKEIEKEREGNNIYDRSEKELLKFLSVYN